MYIDARDWMWADWADSVTHIVTIKMKGMYSDSTRMVRLYRLDRESALVFKMKGSQDIKPKIRNFITLELWHVYKVEKACT